MGKTKIKNMSAAAALLIIAACISSCVATSSEYKAYLKEFGKDFSRLENPSRVQLFEAASKLVNEHNSVPGVNFKLNLNKFADWTPAEIQRLEKSKNSDDDWLNDLDDKLNIFDDDKADDDKADDDKADDDKADDDTTDDFGNSGADDYYVDDYNNYGSQYYGDYQWGNTWKSLNWASKMNPLEYRVTPQVQNQEDSATGWAYATSAALHANANINAARVGGKALQKSLSAPQIVDCSAPTASGRKNDVVQAFEYVKYHGVAATSNYAANSMFKSCDVSSRAVSLKEYTILRPNDELGLLEALKHTPVVVSVCANSKDFLYYSSGVIDSGCGSDATEHNLLLVGYGKDKATGKDFWIVQNSFGRKWGENGFARILRRSTTGSPGALHIASRPVAPLDTKMLPTMSSMLGVAPLTAHLIFFGTLGVIFSAIFVFIKVSMKKDYQRINDKVVAVEDGPISYQRVYSANDEL